MWKKLVHRIKHSVPYRYVLNISMSISGKESDFTNYQQFNQSYYRNLAEPAF